MVESHVKGSWLVLESSAIIRLTANTFCWRLAGWIRRISEILATRLPCKFIGGFQMTENKRRRIGAENLTHELCSALKLRLESGRFFLYNLFWVCTKYSGHLLIICLTLFLECFTATTRCRYWCFQHKSQHKPKSLFSCCCCREKKELKRQMDRRRTEKINQAKTKEKHLAEE